MPTYDYRCSACGHRFEQYQSIKDDPLTLCPSCNTHHAQRQISMGGGVLFRGSGFYETDYRSSSYKEAAKKDSGESKPASDAKPAAAAKPAAPPAGASPAAPSTAGKA